MNYNDNGYETLTALPYVFRTFLAREWERVFVVRSVPGIGVRYRLRTVLEEQGYEYEQLAGSFSPAGLFDTLSARRDAVTVFYGVTGTFFNRKPFKKIITEANRSNAVIAYPRVRGKSEPFPFRGKLFFMDDLYTRVDKAFLNTLPGITFHFYKDALVDYVTDHLDELVAYSGLKRESLIEAVTFLLSPEASEYYPDTAEWGIGRFLDFVRLVEDPNGFPSLYTAFTHITWFHK